MFTFFITVHTTLGRENYKIQDVPGQVPIWSRVWQPLDQAWRDLLVTIPVLDQPPVVFGCRCSVYIRVTEQKVRIAYSATIKSRILNFLRPIAQTLGNTVNLFNATSWNFYNKKSLKTNYFPVPVFSLDLLLHRKTSSPPGRKFHYLKFN
jgi:hypothetical protein